MASRISSQEEAMLTIDAIQRFLVYLSAIGRAEKTIRSYDERLRRFQRFSEESEKTIIEKVTADDLDAYIVHLRKSLSPVSVAGYAQAVKTFFRWCVQRGYITTSPAAHLRKPKVESAARNKAIRDEDFHALLSTARLEVRVMETAILLFLLDTGCRAGELCSLDITDIDLDKYEAHVRGKTGERILDFTDPTAEAMKKWLVERQKRRSEDKNAVFVGDNGKRLTVPGLNSRLKGLAQRAGVKGRHNPQAFRHRVGQGWIDKGANLEIVRLKLGHRDIHTTSLFYANQDRERQKRASERYSLVK